MSSLEGRISLLNKFKRWAKKNSKRRGIICHFYTSEKAKQYYGKVDFAYFNLSCTAREWIVGGTEGHGITGGRGKRSPVNCLNCFQVDDKFFKALGKLDPESNHRFEIGLLLNKRKMRRDSFEDVVDVEAGRPSETPPLSECHKYDDPRFRRVLIPFNFCQVVRVVIPKSSYLKRPIASISSDAIMGILVRQRDYGHIAKCLILKRMEQVEVFPLL